MSFQFSFWGVRGSLSCASQDFMKFGGNTSCVFVEAGPHKIILDAGTGIRRLGDHLIQHNITRSHLFFSHTHWDHITGFPFFTPAFFKNHHIDIFGHLDPLENRLPIKDILSQHMAKPFFPVPLHAMVSQQKYHDFDVGDNVDLGDGVLIRTARLNHPGGSCGYRISYKGASLCYVTDTEHVVGKLDDNILALIENSNAMIYDCTYTQETFAERLGWGHSCWQAGQNLCETANVDNMFMFHHDLDADDFSLERIEKQARTVSPNIFAAREGMVINLL